jgi:hypothetical protein
MANARKSREHRAQEEHDKAESRASKRRRRTRTLGVVLVLLILAAGAVMALSKSEKVQTAAPSTSPAPQTLAQALKSAGCDKVTNVGPFQPEDTMDRSHAGLSPLKDYPSIPPASGPHSGTTTPAGTYAQAPADLATAIHSLEHGAVEIWYAPSVADSPEVSAIKTFVGATPENSDHVVVAPYDYPDQGRYGQLPNGGAMALVSWHNVQTCKLPSLAVAKDFLSKYRYPPLGGGKYLGDAPEPGEVI